MASIFNQSFTKQMCMVLADSGVEEKLHILQTGGRKSSELFSRRDSKSNESGNRPQSPGTAVRRRPPTASARPSSHRRRQQCPPTAPRRCAAPVARQTPTALSRRRHGPHH
uniref:Uncharacterized protein n=1 Tax=Arundo donax TaxID=35708 RepID=A0A0A9E281_ARUDO